MAGEVHYFAGAPIGWRAGRLSDTPLGSGTGATCDPRRPKGLVMVTHGHGEHRAIASGRRTLGEKYIGGL